MYFVRMPDQHCLMKSIPRDIPLSASIPVLFLGGTGDKAAEAMHAIAEAVTQCKFEATNPAADEVVLYKILQVAEITLCPCLPDSADCQWVHACTCHHQTYYLNSVVQMHIDWSS